MIRFKADLHIHSVLSPCGDLDMSPRNIISRAKEENLQIIAVTDHNTLKQSQIVAELAERQNIFPVFGAEISTREEIHCLVFFPDRKIASEFQQFIDRHLPIIENHPELFGYQVVVDAEDNILEEEKRLLISALNVGIQIVEKEVHRLGGIFIPAHIDRSQNSITSQLGFLPAEIKVDALGISKFAVIENLKAKYDFIHDHTLIRSSDAHYPEDIGKGFSFFEIEKRTFKEIRLALLHQKGRSVTAS